MPLLIDLTLSLLSSSTYMGETFTFSQNSVNQCCTNSTAHDSIQSSSQHRSSLFTDRFKLHLTSTGQLLFLCQLKTATTWHFWTGTATGTSWHYTRPTRVYFPLWWTAMVTSFHHSILSWLTHIGGTGQRTGKLQQMARSSALPILLGTSFTLWLTALHISETSTKRTSKENATEQKTTSAPK